MEFRPHIETLGTSYSLMDSIADAVIEELINNMKEQDIADIFAYAGTSSSAQQEIRKELKEYIERTLGKSTIEHVESEVFDYFNEEVNNGGYNPSRRYSEDIPNDKSYDNLYSDDDDIDDMREMELRFGK